MCWRRLLRWMCALEDTTCERRSKRSPSAKDQILENRLVLFLDILGFGAKTHLNHDAVRLNLLNCQEAISGIVREVTAVDYALGLSDSWFFVAKEGKEGEGCEECQFLKQMGNLIWEITRFEYPKNTKSMTPDGNGNVGKSDHAMDNAAKDARVLFRGGMAKGMVHIVSNQPMILAGSSSSTTNLFGEAVTTAASAEKLGKGPSALS